MLGMAPLTVDYDVEEFALATTFRTARVTMDRFHVTLVQVSHDGLRGRGECYASSRFGWDTKRVAAALEALPAAFKNTSDVQALDPSPVRNALDCALWDLRAKEQGQRAWQAAGLKALRPVQTMTTVSMMSRAELERVAGHVSKLGFIKLKVGHPDDLENLRLVRAIAPHARILVDANEGWTVETYSVLAPELARLAVCMIEQPLKASEDHALEYLPRPVAVCADESFYRKEDLGALRSRYDAINVKLDKVGGLTAALDVMKQAKGMGFQIVVGCMLGTSLAIAPALIAAQEADFVDLDAHLLCRADRQPGLVTQDGFIAAPDAALWG